MPNLGGIAKYLSLFSIGKGFIDKIVLQRLLVGVAGVIALTVVAAILAGAIIIGLFGLIYYAIVDYTEVSEMGALAIVGALILVLIGVLVYKIMDYSKRISTASTLLMQTSMPASPLADIATAFINGLKEPSSQKDKSKTYPTSVK